MTHNAGSLLILESDPQLVGDLVAEATRRAYRVRVASTPREAFDLVSTDAFDAILLDLDPGTEATLDLATDLSRTAADIEVVILSDRAAVNTAIQWFDPQSFTFARRSSPTTLFAAVAGALERRRITAQNRRLVWELQTVNEIASGIASSLDVEDVMAGALQNIVRAMDALGGSIRLRDPESGEFDRAVVAGPASLRDLWTGDAPLVPRPSDRVIATRETVIVDDLRTLAGEDRAAEVGLRSAISVPLLAGGELVGTLSIGSAYANRFTPADERLLATLAGQIVLAIQNAQLHQRIIRAKHQLEQTFDAIGDPIAVFNRHGELLRGNRALATHLSVPVQSLQGLTCAEVGFCAGSSCPNCGTVEADRTAPRRSEVTLRDGRIFSVTTFSVALPGEGPAVAQLAKNVTDEILGARRVQQMSDELAATNRRLVAAIDQLKTAQAQLVQAEKLSAIGRLVAGVAHELNNPLTSVIGYAQLIEDELRNRPGDDPSSQLRDDLQHIAEEADRAARIVRNLLAFARRQSVARAPQDVVELCEKVLALRDYEFRLNRIELETDFAADLPTVFADPGHLQQLLLNLVLNAERAMRGATVRHLRVAVRRNEAANAIEIAVADSGHGIENENMSRIFDPFFTTREVGEGAGLGLSICYGIARDHGGHIEVESVPRVGTTFRVTLPARLSDRAVDECTVLVAQPDRADREFAIAALTGWGFRTVTADTPALALEIAARPDVAVALVDRQFVAANPAAWRTALETDGEHAAMVIVATGAEDGEPFEGLEVSAVLVPPLELYRLHVVVQACVKECV